MSSADDYLIKLVRDKIPDVVNRESTVTFKNLEHDAHVRMLRRKLIEEAIEYLEDPSSEELVDVLAVVQALASVDLQLPWSEVEQELERKNADRGGFEEGIGMFASSSTNHSADG